MNPSTAERNRAFVRNRIAAAGLTDEIERLAADRAGLVDFSDDELGEYDPDSSVPESWEEQDAHPEGLTALLTARCPTSDTVGRWGFFRARTIALREGTNGVHDRPTGRRLVTRAEVPSRSERVPRDAKHVGFAHDVHRAQRRGCG